MKQKLSFLPIIGLRFYTQPKSPVAVIFYYLYQAVFIGAINDFIS